MDLTYVYMESVAGGFVGAVNEIPGAISQAEDIKELEFNLSYAGLALLGSEAALRVISGERAASLTDFIRCVEKRWRIA